MATNLSHSQPSTPAFRSIRAGYDREASQYDARRYESLEGRLFNDLELRILREWLPLGPGTKVLDVPAGTGRLTVALAETGATVIGADISANMLKMAAQKRAAAPDASVHLMQGSGAQLPFADNTFDAVLSFKFFHLIPNHMKRMFVVEMTRVLKPGKPVVFEFNSPFYGGVMAAFRYYFRKKKAGGMRFKCLFPDQIPWLFEGLEVTRKIGVKVPFTGIIARLFGRRFADGLNLWFGKLPGLKYLAYTIIVEARKPAR